MANDMLEHKLRDLKDIPYLEEKRGLVCIRHKPTDKILFARGDVKNVVKFTHRYLMAGTYHNIELQALINDPSELEYTYTYTDDPDTLRAKLMTEYYLSGRVLNNTHWPKIIAAFKYTHIETGYFYVGTAKDVIKAHSYQMSLLRFGTHKSPELQKLYDLSKDINTFKRDVVICQSSEEAKYWADKWKLEDEQHCVNSKRFLPGFNNVGAYVITHNKTGHYYVGSSAKMRSRWGYHMWALNKNIHKNLKFQEIHNTYGDDWSCKYLGRKTREEAYALEQKLIDAGQGDELFINSSSNARSTISGVILDAEAEARAHNNRLRNLSNPDTRRRVKDANVKLKGKPVYVDGIIYKSMRQALDVVTPGKGGWAILYKRLNDPNDTQCHYV